MGKDLPVTKLNGFIQLIKMYFLAESRTLSNNLNCWDDTTSFHGYLFFLCAVPHARIQPLSDALGDLYKEFNALKERLGELTTKFDGVEAFVDDVRAGRSPAPPKAEPRPPGLLPGEENATPTDEGHRPQGRRNRVVVRRIKKPGGSQA